MTEPVAPRLYPSGGLQLQLHLMHEGQTAMVVLGGHGPIASLSTNLASAWRDHAWGAFRSLCSADVTCTGATLRDVSIADGAAYEVGTPSVTPAGAGLSGSVIAAGCTLIAWRTGVGGRRGRGRTFLPGLPSAAVNADGRTYAASHSSAAATAVSAYLTPGTGLMADVTPAVLSFTYGLATPITSGSLSQVIGLQRRRMR